MTNVNKTKTLFAVAALLIACAVQAEESVNTISTPKSEASAAAAPKKWKAELNSLFYDFEGAKSANNDLYTFGNSTLNLELLTVQYQASSDWTFMAVGQYMDNYVETTMFGTTYRDRVKGFGDTFLAGMTPLYLSSSMLLFGDLGVSLPTGSINVKNENNPYSDTHLAYNMQLGSGTYDAVLGLTPIYLNGPIQVGSHLTSILRNGRNSNGYRLGNLYKADAWVDYSAGAGFTPRVVAYYKIKEAINGTDETLGRSDLTEFYYHRQINWDVSAALKYEKTVGPVALTAEVGKPFYQGSQNVDAVVVATDYYANIKAAGSF